MFLVLYTDINEVTPEVLKVATHQFYENVLLQEKYDQKYDTQIVTALLPHELTGRAICRIRSFCGIHCSVSYSFKYSIIFVPYITGGRRRDAGHDKSAV